MMRRDRPLLLTLSEAHNCDVRPGKHDKPSVVPLSL